MEIKLIRKLEVCIGPIGESNLKKYGQQMVKVTAKYIAVTVVCNKLLPFFFVCRANVANVLPVKNVDYLRETLKEQSSRVGGTSTLSFKMDDALPCLLSSC